jgi:beta-lactam-binding protein with PASTA domain
MLLLRYLKSKIFLRTIITLLVSAVIGIFLLKMVLKIATHHDQKIIVPSLAKMSLEETDKVLNNINLTFVVIDSASFNPDYPPHSVIDQDPESGDFVKKHRKIYLTINPSNYRKIGVPDIFGKTKRQVETHLKSIGFRIGEYYYIPDLGKNVVRKLRYKGKDLKLGDLIPKNSEIDLVLGDGKGGEKSSNEIAH